MNRGRRGLMVMAFLLGLLPASARAGWWLGRGPKVASSQNVTDLVRAHLAEAGQEKRWDVKRVVPSHVKGQAAAWQIELVAGRGESKTMQLTAAIYPEQQRGRVGAAIGGSTTLAALADRILRADTGQGTDAWRLGRELHQRRGGRWELSAGGSPKTWPFLGDRTITLQLAEAPR